MAKKANINVMAEKLYTLAEDASIEAAISQFNFKKPVVAEGTEPTAEQAEQLKKCAIAEKMMRHHLRAFVQRMNANGVLDQSLLTTIGVLTSE